MARALRVVAWAAVIAGIGCGGRASPTTPTAETITGSERLGWTQPADDPARALSSYTYAVYVDEVMAPLRDAVCQAAGSSGLACSSPLPPLSAGRHVLEVVAIDGSGVIGGRSQPLTVTVAAG